MLVAHHLVSLTLSSYSCKFSRHDFTLPQLFACLTVKEQMKRSYRGAEALLRDAAADQAIAATRNAGRWRRPSA